VNGNRFFDEILVFIQHLPWMLIVTGEVALRLHARWGPKFDRKFAESRPNNRPRKEISDRAIS
jgi:hypothetical protein